MYVGISCCTSWARRWSTAGKGCWKTTRPTGTSRKRQRRGYSPWRRSWRPCEQALQPTLCPSEIVNHLAVEQWYGVGWHASESSAVKQNSNSTGVKLKACTACRIQFCTRKLRLNWCIVSLYHEVVIMRHKCHKQCNNVKHHQRSVKIPNCLASFDTLG